MGLLRTLLIIVVIYYLLKVLGRWLFPKAVQYTAKKMQERFQEQQAAYHRDETKVKEGETLIDSYPSQKKNTDKKVGEYIDFEEID